MMHVHLNMQRQTCKKIVLSQRHQHKTSPLKQKTENEETKAESRNTKNNY